MRRLTTNLITVLLPAPQAHHYQKAGFPCASSPLTAVSAVLRAQPARCCLKCGNGAAAEGTRSPRCLEITVMAGSLDQHKSKGVSRNRPRWERHGGAHSGSFSNHTSIPPSASQPLPPALGVGAFRLVHPSCKGLSTLCRAQCRTKPSPTRRAASAQAGPEEAPMESHTEHG